MCQANCNQGRINAPARPLSKQFPVFLSLLAQMESFCHFKEGENEYTEPKVDAPDGTMTTAYKVFCEKEADYVEFQVCSEVSASQGTHNKVSVKWKYSWNRNRDQDLAISSTSCQRPLSSCPSVLFPKSLQ